MEFLPLSRRRFSSLNVPGSEERGETDVFAGYVRNDSETVYSRFSKYAKRFKENHLKAYNITNKHQQRSLFLDSIGEATLDIFEQLDDTGTDLDGAITALLNKFKESQNRLFNIHNFVALYREKMKPGTCLSLG